VTAKNLSIAWFRQDLRMADNPALSAAAECGDVLPIYILDDVNAGDWGMGAASRAWLHHSLVALNESLDGRLVLFRGNAREIIEALATGLPVNSVFWNRCYEPWRIQRDAQIKFDLSAHSIEHRSYNGTLLWEPWTVNKKDGTPYRVFTPYYQKGCLSQPAPRQPLPPPGRIRWHNETIAASRALNELDLLPLKMSWHESLLSHWQVGETAALRRMDSFCDDCLDTYKRGRDFPALDATSRLSPHLHFGEISPHQAWHRIGHATMSNRSDGPAHFLREIAWREFSYHLLYHFPQLPVQNFNRKFDGFQWLEDESSLQAWQRGQTGFPIVDAGLRELWQTGYMHNRVRMIVASFLIKNMLLHWREGQAWFWDCLVDADLASNSASWQWCAGSGADAAPYFRIFNPVLQSEKFDPAGDYLLRYCPELAGLPARFRHKPWQASAEILRAAGITLGVDYPEPILDLKVTRERALARYKALR
jgi:deoxyribodipyrimidine photo-lyase